MNVFSSKYFIAFFLLFQFLFSFFSLWQCAIQNDFLPSVSHTVARPKSAPGLRKNSRSGHGVEWCDVVTMFFLRKKSYFWHIFPCAWFAISDLPWKQRFTTDYTVGHFTSLRNAVTCEAGTKWHFIEIIIISWKNLWKSQECNLLWPLLTSYQFA